MTLLQDLYKALYKGLLVGTRLKHIYLDCLKREDAEHALYCTKNRERNKTQTEPE